MLNRLYDTSLRQLRDLRNGAKGLVWIFIGLRAAPTNCPRVFLAALESGKLSPAQIERGEDHVCGVIVETT